jgi:hypothetical protein
MMRYGALAIQHLPQKIFAGLGVSLRLSLQLWDLRDF